MIGTRTNEICKATAALSLAVIIAVAVGLNYYDMPMRLFEMTFLSNALAALILFVGAMRLYFFGRDIPHFLYLDITVLLLMVVGICAIYAPGVCFTGRSVMLHMIDPIAVALFYTVFCDGRGSKIVSAFTALVVPSMYYAFMIIYGVFTGTSVYIYFNTTVMSPLTLVLDGIVAAAALTAVSIGLLMLSMYLHSDGGSAKHKEIRRERQR